MFKRLLRPHAILLSLAILIFIWLLGQIRLNMHYLDPFHNGLKDYEITDIVYSNLGQSTSFMEDRIVIVNSGRPDRARLAALVDKLNEAGASVIGLDIYFSQTTGAPEDTLLQRSIQQAGNVVLACTLKDDDKTDDRLEGINGVDTFFSNHAVYGYGNYPSNSTKTIRVFSPQETVNGEIIPAFATAILGVYNPIIQRTFLQRSNELEHIYFSGHKPDFISNDIDRILDSMTVDELKLSCENRIILVGYAPEDPWANPLLDRHYTPLNAAYDTKSIPDMFGIVVHANVLSMILNERYIYTVPSWLAYLISVLICYGNVLLFRWIYRRFHEAFHGITRAIQLFQFILIFFLVALVFYYFHLQIDLKTGIFSTLLAYDFIMIYESLVLPRVAFLRNWPKSFPPTTSNPPPIPDYDDDHEPTQLPPPFPPPIPDVILPVPPLTEEE